MMSVYSQTTHLRQFQRVEYGCHSRVWHRITQQRQSCASIVQYAQFRRISQTNSMQRMRSACLHTNTTHLKRLRSSSSSWSLTQYPIRRRYKRPFNIFGYKSVTRVTVIAQSSAVSILLLPRLINVRARRFLSAVLEENTSEMTDMRVEG